MRDDKRAATFKVVALLFAVLNLWAVVSVSESGGGSTDGIAVGAKFDSWHGFDVTIQKKDIQGIEMAGGDGIAGIEIAVVGGSGVAVPYSTGFFCHERPFWGFADAIKKRKWPAGTNIVDRGAGGASVDRVGVALSLASGITGTHENLGTFDVGVN